MRYLGNASSDSVREAMRRGWVEHPTTGARLELGQMTTPGEGREPLTAHDGEPVWFAADNGIYSLAAKGRTFDPDRWHTWLTRLVAGREHRCLFAVAPDVFNADLGNDMGPVSLDYSLPYLTAIRELGVPAALVMQNGITPRMLAPHWHAFDVVFLGGCLECVPCGWVPTLADLDRIRDTRDRTCQHCGRELVEWKLSRAAHRIVNTAKPDWRPDAAKPVHMGRANSARRLRRAEAMGVDSADGTFLTRPDTNLPRLARWGEDNLFTTGAAA